jgi:uncharacterized protein DUF5916/cellulose/xylan binding protein with CBM9 domain
VAQVRLKAVCLRTVVCFVAAACVEAVLASASAAQPHGPVPTVQAVRVTDAPRIDGALDDTAWRNVTPATEFVQRDPDEGKPATERTELRIVFDDSAIYVGVKLYDREPARIVRRLTRRDTFPDADRFTIFFDPHHDHLTGAMFTVSAAGSQSDAIIYNDTWEDQSWDAVWDAAVSTDGEGWSAEMRIPFSQLRFPRRARDAWGINASRFIQRRNETDWLQLVPKKENGLASRMAHLVGVQGVHAPRQFEIVPYTVARAEFVQPDAPGNPFNDGSRMFGGTGVDLKYGLTSNFTLNAAINPDFGQVEVDPAVVNLTAFETFFSEKRPFFIEGSQIFDNFGRSGSNSFWGFNNAEPQIFYSRRIGRSPQGSATATFVDRPSASTILAATKLTGKTANGWNIGLLDAVTSREHARLDGADRDKAEIEPLTNYFVGRVQREIKRVAFGMLTTWVQRDLSDALLRDQLPASSVVVGGDGHVFLDSKRDWVVTGSLSGSRIAGTTRAITQAQEASLRYFQRPDALRLNPDATSMSGWAGRINLNRNSGVWQANAALWGVSPGYDTSDAGFTFRAGVQGAHGVLMWRKPTPDRFTRNRNIFGAKWWTWDSNRVKQSDGIMLAAFGQFLNYWSFGTQAFLVRRAQDSWGTRGGPLMIEPGGASIFSFLSTDDRKRLVVGFNGNYDRNEYGAWSGRASTSIEFKPSSSVRISVEPELSRSHSLAQYVQTTPDESAVQTYGSRYVFSDLDQTQVSMSTRATWVMKPRMSLQVYAQPLLAAGDYWNFKSLAAPRTFVFERFVGDVGEPDFNFKSLRVNAVYRWEWRLGSTLYIVWTEQRENSRDPGTFALGRDARALFRAPPDDVFMVKVSYWLSR